MADVLAEMETAIFRESLPESFVASELLAEQEIRARVGLFIGQVATCGAVSAESLPEERRIETLHEAIQRAHEGDQQARQMVEINVRTDVVERTIKTGHVMEKVPIHVTDDGKLVQHGQVMDSIQANSLRYASDNPVMRARTEAETRNAFRTERYYEEGWFEHYSLLVISRAEELPEYGFFTETMSCSLQLTSKADEGLALESAFVAGIAADGKAAHDEATTIELGLQLGADYRGKLPAEIIDTPILIRNDLIPNGVIDVVAMWDSIAGTFFGEDRPAEDYVEYLERCHAREAQFGPKVQEITNELVSAADRINTPVAAIKLLHDLSGRHMVEKAIADPTIDSRVFGQEAAAYINAGRQAYAQGDLIRLESLTEKAKQTERSSSCPTGMSGAGPDGSNIDNNESVNDSADCDFISKECPLCHTKNVKTKVRKLQSSGLKRISGSCGCVKFV